MTLGSYGSRGGSVTVPSSRTGTVRERRDITRRGNEGVGQHQDLDGDVIVIVTVSIEPVGCLGIQETNIQ